jgi:hypothetical protein
VAKRRAITRAGNHSASTESKTDIHMTARCSASLQPSRRSSPAIAATWPIAKAGVDNSAGPTPKTLPGRPRGVGPKRYQLPLTWYWFAKSRSRSSTSDGR